MKLMEDKTEEWARVRSWRILIKTRLKILLYSVDNWKPLKTVVGTTLPVLQQGRETNLETR